MRNRETHTALTRALGTLLGLLLALGTTLDLSVQPVDDMPRGVARSFHALALSLGLTRNDYVVAIVLVIAFALLATRSLDGIWSGRLHLTPAIVITSLFFGFSCTFGWAFATLSGAEALFDGGVQTTKTALSFLSWAAVFAFGTLHLLELIRTARGDSPRHRADPKPARALLAFAQHPVLCTTTILCVAWLPWLIAYAPGLLGADACTEISMWFNLPTYQASLVVLLDEGVLLTQHHTVLHPAMLGTCVWLGRTLFASDSLGLLLYTILQVLAAIASISYAAGTSVRLGARPSLTLTAVCLLALSPVFGKYVVLTTKDVPFTSAMVAALFTAAKLMGEEGSDRADWACMAVFGLLGSLLRNGALLFVLALLLIVVWKAKTSRGSAVVVTVVVAAISLACTNVLWPALKLTPPSSREVLSIPFQQTARYMSEHPDDITAEEYEAVDTLLGASNIAKRYNPRKSDDVKNRFKADATEDEIRAYFGAWLSMGSRHPLTYLSATANNYYGYFYLGQPTRNSFTRKWAETCMANQNELGFDLHWLGREDGISDLLKDCVAVVEDLVVQVPVIELAVSSAFYVWFLIGMTLLCWEIRPRSNANALLAVLWLMLAVNLVGPCDGSWYFRYTYPIAVCVVLLFPLVLTSLLGSSCPRGKHRRSEAPTRAVTP